MSLTPTKRSHHVRVAAARVGAVGGMLAQLLLVIIGASFVLAEETEEAIVLLVAWCLVGGAYLLTVFIVLSVRAVQGVTERPLSLEFSFVGRVISFIATLLASLVGMGAAFQHIFRDTSDEAGMVLDFVSIGAMLLSWGLFHWGFAQLYLQTYYRSDEPTLQFPKTKVPSIVEFAYFSFTLATSFATSDVVILSTRTRWIVTCHTVFGFFFNGLIVVLAFGAIAAAGDFFR